MCFSDTGLRNWVKKDHLGTLPEIPWATEMTLAEQSFSCWVFTGLLFLMTRLAHSSLNNYTNEGSQDNTVTELTERSQFHRFPPLRRTNETCDYLSGADKTQRICPGVSGPHRVGNRQELLSSFYLECCHETQMVLKNVCLMNESMT